MKLTIDFETRSECDLRSCGAWVYSEHPTTEILMCAVAEDDHLPRIWVRPEFGVDLFVANISVDKLNRLLDEADVIEAHNAEFERALLQNCGAVKYGLHIQPLEKWRCSAARAAQHALPRNLAGACEALGLRQQKDREGYSLMMRMCKPQKVSKSCPRGWLEDRESVTRLARYCMQDVVAERELSQALGDMPERELRVWRLDAKLNARGIRLDLDGCRALIALSEEVTQAYVEEFKALTGGTFNPTQRDVLLAWLREDADTEIDDLKAKTVDAAMKHLPEGKVKRVLEIRRAMSLASVKKLDAMTARASRDGRARGTFLYHGASTGRWSGKGLQPQNFVRDSWDQEETDTVIAHARYGAEFVRMLWNEPMAAISRCLRGLITCDDGNELICADFASIEARATAWLAGQENIVQAFRDGKDVYKLAACGAFKLQIEQIDKPKRFAGKTIVLACGYQGGYKAFRRMEASQGLNLGLTDDEVKKLIQAWREANPCIVRLWYDLEAAAITATKQRTSVTLGRLALRADDKWLRVRLPSGRVLFYARPVVRVIDDPFREGKKKEALFFWGVDERNKWTEQQTYGGKLTENVVQALCRDLCAEAMLRLEDAGYPVVLTVHDEIGAEVKSGFGSVEQFNKIMCVVPAWAEGMPINAEGWRGRRYRK